MEQVVSFRVDAGADGEAVLKQTGGVIEGPKGAARILDLHPNTLRHRINKLGIKPTHRIS